MNKNDTLKLDATDPRVIAAEKAEQQLFDFYGLKPKTHFITLPGFGLRIRVTEIGVGKPVMIVPGNTGDSFPLMPLLAELKDRRIIAVNRPGGGLSEGMDHHAIGFRQLAVLTLTTVLDALDIDRVPIIAHSIGGHWSLWMAMDKPERVSALILLGVPGNIINTRPPFALRLLTVPVLNNLLFKLITPKSSKESLRGLSFLGHSSETVAALPQALAECYYYFQKLPHYQISSISLIEVTNGLLKDRPEITITDEQLKTIQQPTMFLWGTNDPFGTAETGEQISRMMASSEFHAIQSGGHLPWLDDVVMCGKLIQEFISKY